MASLKVMRKVIATMNMTLDGFCDHTAMIADDEIHGHYADLLNSGDTVLYGRVTYQLMESYWPAVLKNPTGNKADDDFAVAIDKIEKVVFSRTLKDVEWASARVAERDLEAEVRALREQDGADIFVASPGLIVGLTKLGLIDEYQICVQPTIVGKGLRLFNDVTERVDLNLIKTKTFATSGTVLLCHETRRDPRS